MHRLLLIIVSLISLGVSTAHSQEDAIALKNTFVKLDSILFVEGFNKCQIAQIKPLISDDLEFYHDQGGKSTKAEFFEAVEKNICSDWNAKPVRELVDGSMQLYPLYNGGVLYGMIQEGSHEFYIQEPKKELYLTSTAKFTHVWMLSDGEWLLTRVLSYDHQSPE